jgi:hypothetical protein
MLTYMPAMKLEESIGDFYQRFCHVLNAVQANGFHMVAYTKLSNYFITKLIYFTLHNGFILNISLFVVHLFL